ncbi:hypothetical protein [Nocardia amikacinitolerans]|uniref:hypothetical protein n=1 Tax=Nocardia amikacinitolerans TaxID=756689 RepID=UPI0020A3590B|nr:hypothetical protein [Nocardia amikacinitolerans]MCP2278705.1 hypothetical protein [Nocardia amikacinitolerans]
MISVAELDKLREALGLRTATLLSRQDTWDALYEDAFDDGSPDRSDPPRKRK